MLQLSHKKGITNENTESTDYVSEKKKMIGEIDSFEIFLSTSPEIFSTIKMTNKHLRRTEYLLQWSKLDDEIQTKLMKNVLNKL